MNTFLDDYDLSTLEVDQEKAPDELADYDLSVLEKSKEEPISHLDGYDLSKVGEGLKPMVKVFRGLYEGQKWLFNPLDAILEDEPESKKLIQKENQPSKPQTDTRLATINLLQHVDEAFRDEALEEISKLIKENKLFSEEAVNRLEMINPEQSRKILLTGEEEGKEFQRDISLSQALREGYQESVSGILTGRGVQDYETLLARAQGEIPFWKRQAKNVTKIFGDLPAFITGGAISSLPLGGPGTPFGSIAAMSGGFATQTLIESAYNEGLRLVNAHPELKGKTLEQLSAIVTDQEALQNIGLST